VGLLEDAERSLLEVVAVFVDGWTVDAAAQVAGLDEDRALDLTEVLARHSLIYLDPAGEGPGRGCWRLSARLWPSGWRPGRRRRGRAPHAGYYRALAEQADRPLRGAGQRGWCERLDAEEGNLAAAVGWYLAHDTGPLPHMFRVLWLFWFLRDHLGEARSWVSQLLPTAGSFDLQAGSNWCGQRRRPASRWATTKRRWRPASAWRRCSTGSGTPTSALCPS
jgi:hypothetical protein